MPARSGVRHASAAGSSSNSGKCRGHAARAVASSRERSASARPRATAVFRVRRSASLVGVGRLGRRQRSSHPALILGETGSVIFATLPRPTASSASSARGCGAIPIRRSPDRGSGSRTRSGGARDRSGSGASGAAIKAQRFRKRTDARAAPAASRGSARQILALRRLLARLHRSVVGASRLRGSAGSGSDAGRRRSEAAGLPALELAELLFDRAKQLVGVGSAVIGRRWRAAGARDGARRRRRRDPARRGPATGAERAWRRRLAHRERCLELLQQARPQDRPQATSRIGAAARITFGFSGLAVPKSRRPR